MHWCTCSCLQCSVLILHIHFTCFDLRIWFSMCVLPFPAIFKHWFRAMTQMMCYSLCCCWMFLVSIDLGVSVELTVSKWYRSRWIFCLTTVRNLHINPGSWFSEAFNSLLCERKHPSRRGRWVRFHWTTWKNSILVWLFGGVWIFDGSGVSSDVCFQKLN